MIPDVLPAPILIMVLALLCGSISSNSLGVALYAIGSDAAAASQSRRCEFTRFLSFTIAGVFFGWAGLFITANSGSGDPLIGTSFLLKVFAVVVLGGTLIGGGRGGAMGTVFGALTLTIVVNIFLVLGVRTYYVPIVEGAILLLAVLGLGNRMQFPRLANLRGIGCRWRRQILCRFMTASNALRKAAERSGSAASSGLGHQTRDHFALRVAGLRHSGGGDCATAAINGSHFQFDTYLVSLLTFCSFLDSRIGARRGHYRRRSRSIGAMGDHLPGNRGDDLCQRFRRRGDMGDPSRAGHRRRDRVVQWRAGGRLWAFPRSSRRWRRGACSRASPWCSATAPRSAMPLPLCCGSSMVAWRIASGEYGFWGCLWLIGTFVLNGSGFGRRVRALGNSEWVARLSGVRTRDHHFRLRAERPLLCNRRPHAGRVCRRGLLRYGKPYLLASIAAVVIGGTSISGGRSHYFGILGGALLFTAMGSMLQTTSLPEAVRSIIYGGRLADRRDHAAREGGVDSALI